MGSLTSFSYKLEHASNHLFQKRCLGLLIIGAVFLFTIGAHLQLESKYWKSVKVPRNAAQIIARCENLKQLPGPPPEFYSRNTSDRYVTGTESVLIKNAKIWTGNENGKEIISGDILLDGGLIKWVGSNPNVSYEDLKIYDAKGSWVTPGIVDLHSHLGVFSIPKLNGAADTNSRKGIVQPWLRSLDALNTQDDGFHLSMAGGITSALILPGSANSIGGQAFVIKLRSTKERTPTAMLVEPPFTLNSSELIDWSAVPRWRHMKFACGENPKRVYGNSRMDNIWAYREIYDKAQKIKESQDSFCQKVSINEWDGLDAFPDDLQYEALVDVLRGRVKVQVHCYEAVDLDDIVRLSNEFRFPIAAFHHAHETYLVPDLLKKAYGNIPASAMFATNARYKREAYRGSEFAAKILAENDIPVVMKSDHPVLNSRYLLYEAQQAHYYGLPANLALASVTLTPAQAMGMDHRIGFIREGYDADLVIWDSHPLSLGATPKQVFIDGIAQLGHAFVSEKPGRLQKAPNTPNFIKEAKDAVKYDGLPPLAPERSLSGTVIFTNISYIAERSADGEHIVSIFESSGADVGHIVVESGVVVCAGTQVICSSYTIDPQIKVIDLKGGSVSPGLISFGSALGLEEIHSEASTRDGDIYDPFEKLLPERLGGNSILVHASDGLQFATRHAYLSYRAGVTIGITAPAQLGFIGGLSTAFRTGAEHKLEPEAVVQESVAVHAKIGHSTRSTSISTQISYLRNLLIGQDTGDIGNWFKRIREGKTTLVVEANSADIIATLIGLKKEVELRTGHPIKLTIVGAAEAHLLVSEIASSNVGLIVNPSRPFPDTWEYRRVLPGPPLSKEGSVSLFLSHNITVGIGSVEPWNARNTRFDAGWAALEGSQKIPKHEAFALASINLEKLLGLENRRELSDLVLTEGGDLLDFGSKVIGVISPRKSAVDLF